MELRSKMQNGTGLTWGTAKPCMEHGGGCACNCSPWQTQVSVVKHGIWRHEMNKHLTKLWSLPQPEEDVNYYRCLTNKTKVVEIIYVSRKC